MRLPAFMDPYRADTPAFGVALLCIGVLVSVFATAGHHAEQPRPPAPAKPSSPYQTCIAAANTPGDAGFATEVCEPLAPDYDPPTAWLHPGDFGGGVCLFFSWRQIDPLTTKKPGTGIRYCPEVKP